MTSLDPSQQGETGEDRVKPVSIFKKKVEFRLQTLRRLMNFQ